MTLTIKTELVAYILDAEMDKANKEYEAAILAKEHSPDRESAAKNEGIAHGWNEAYDRMRIIRGLIHD